MIHTSRICTAKVKRLAERDLVVQQQHNVRKLNRHAKC